jgi:hypothetical protein
MSNALNPKNNMQPANIMMMASEVITDPEEIKNHTWTFWENMFVAGTPMRSPPLCCYKKSRPMLMENDNELITQLISIEELNATLLALLNNSAPGPDKITYKIIKALDTDNQMTLLNYLNEYLHANNLPDEWKKSKIWTIHKKGDKTNLNNYRPLALCQTMYKLLTLIINKRLYAAVERQNILSNAQSAFRRNRSTLVNIVTLQNLINKALAKDQQLMALFIDLEKAYDLLPHRAITAMLGYYGASESVKRLITKLY